MTTFVWSDYNDGDFVPFDAEHDLFIFDDPGVAAALVGLSSAPGSVFFSHASKGTVELRGLDLRTITTDNVTFTDGSMLKVGDNSTDIVNDDLANTLSGGGGNDQLIGLGGDDVLMAAGGDDNLQGGDGNDEL